MKTFLQYIEELWLEYNKVKKKPLNYYELRVRQNAYNKKWKNKKRNEQ